MKYNLEELLSKYEQGLCNAEETLFVEGVLNDAEAEAFPLYDAFVQKEREIISSLEVDLVIEDETPERLLERFEAGTATSSQSDKIESLFDNTEKSMPAEYQAFVELERSYQSNLNVEEFVSELVKNTEENIDQLLKQSELQSSSAYSSFLDAERARVSRTDVADLIRRHVEEQESSPTEAKVVPMRSLASRWKSLAGIAAVLIVMLTAVVLFPTNEEDTGGYATVNGKQIDDPELAMEYALAILGKTSKEFEKGTDNMRHLKDLRHTEIFK